MKNTHAPLLVVDDEEANRDLLSRRLNRAGYSVEIAADGEQALQMIADREIELVLLDIMMPGMSGLELLKLLRATYSPTALPVIMVSALNESERVVEALNLGANDYITRPIDFPVATARINSHLARKWTEEALRESEERYALAARGANDGLWDWDLKANRIYYSPRWKEMLGYSEHDIGDNPDEWLTRIHDEDWKRVNSELTSHWSQQNQGEYISEHRILHKNGSYRWVLSRGIVLHAKNGDATRMAGSLTDITDSKAYDVLTGLPNRVLFTERLIRSIEQTRSKPSNLFAVLFVDLDRFKVVNDSLGHLVGDQLLVGVTKRLGLSVRVEKLGRGEDIIARLGGDEFAILLTNLDRQADAVTIADRIQQDIHDPFSLEGREVYTTASIGIAISDAHYRTPEEILRDADTAMYRAKALGGARCVVFDAVMRANAIDRLDLENDLRKALERNELAVYYQPKMNLATEKIIGFEALIRWQHPTRGLVLPGKFIPLAEETGLIVPIGLWILREACLTLKKWHTQVSTDPPVEGSVNVSVKQFQQAGFVEDVARILEETELNPSTLQLEITESVLMDDAGFATSILYRLKALGIGLKIDDFGTGYSCLNYLHQLPFDSLKIDRSFVVNMTKDKSSADVVHTILTLARNLTLQVIAEGIETEEQLEHLKSLGCIYGQGFYFSEPLPKDIAEDYLVASLAGKKPVAPSV